MGQESGVVAHRGRTHGGWNVKRLFTVRKPDKRSADVQFTFSSLWRVDLPISEYIIDLPSLTCQIGLLGDSVPVKMTILILTWSSLVLDHGVLMAHI